MVQLNKVANKVIKGLPDRAQDVLSRRFGLGKNDESETLEAIGVGYGITRERVRQIEAAALTRIRTKHETDLDEVYGFLHNEIAARGGVVHEDNFLNSFGNKKNANACSLFLNLGDDFKRLREDDEFHHRWTNDGAHAEKVQAALVAVRKGLTPKDLLSEDEIVSNLVNSSNGLVTKAQAISVLGVSRKIGKNSIEEWGLNSSSQVRPRGVRDLAHLVLRKHGKPMHFTEIAKVIKSTLGEHAHVQTVHNELIKDSQFVLVGRGLYGLTSMGYRAGVVSDVIGAILKEQGPLSRESIIDSVLKERYVKESTIHINLQNKKLFKKMDNGHFMVV
jgi:hypothetical protein